jgi:hypothetical protein
MELDPDTFLVAVYCLVDDLYRERFAPLKPRRPGRRPRLSDGEVLTLALLGQWRRDRSERAFLRVAAARWRAYFPRLLSQGQFNRRVRALGGVLAALGPAVAEALGRLGSAAAPYEAADGTPVPVMRRCRGRRHRCFGDEVGVGRGGSDRQLYYGLRLLATVRPPGAITGWVAVPAATAERWALDALLCWRADPAARPPSAAELAPRLGPSHQPGGRRAGHQGPVGPRHGAGRPGRCCVADLAFRGPAWQAHWRDDYGAAVLTRAEYATLPDARQRRRWTAWLAALRQVVETAFGSLAEVFGLAYPRARSYPGLVARLGAKVAAHNALVYVNHLFGRPAFAAFDPLEAT